MNFRDRWEELDMPIEVDDFIEKMKKMSYMGNGHSFEEFVSYLILKVMDEDTYVEAVNSILGNGSDGCYSSSFSLLSHHRYHAEIAGILPEGYTLTINHNEESK